MKMINTTEDVSFVEALEIFLDADPSYSGGLSNHGPMAIEALVHMGVPHWIGPFVDHYRVRLEPARRATEPAPREWGTWVRSVLPSLVSKAGNLAGHGLLRTAHAVRAAESADADDGRLTDAHRRELATAVDYWRRGGPGVEGPPALAGSLGAEQWLASLGRLEPEERHDGLLTFTLATAAARDGFHERVASLAPALDPIETFDALGLAAAEAFLRNSGTAAFALLHGTTVSAMASVLVPYVDEAEARRLEAAVATFVAAAIVGFDDDERDRPATTASSTRGVRTPRELAEAAGASCEDHTIKFVDACLGIAARSPNDKLLVATERQIEEPYGL